MWTISQAQVQDHNRWETTQIVGGIRCMPSLQNLPLPVACPQSLHPSHFFSFFTPFLSFPNILTSPTCTWSSNDMDRKAPAFPLMCGKCIIIYLFVCLFMCLYILYYIDIVLYLYSAFLPKLRGPFSQVNLLSLLSKLPESAIRFGCMFIIQGNLLTRRFHMVAI